MNMIMIIWFEYDLMVCSEDSPHTRMHCRPWREHLYVRYSPSGRTSATYNYHHVILYTIMPLKWMTINYAQFSSVHFRFFARSWNDWNAHLSLFVAPTTSPNACAQVGPHHFHHGRTYGSCHAALRWNSSGLDVDRFTTLDYSILFPKTGETMRDIWIKMNKS